MSSTEAKTPKFADAIPAGRTVTGVARKPSTKSVNRLGTAVAKNQSYEQRKQQKEQLKKAKELEDEIKKDMEVDRQNEIRKIKQRREAKMHTYMMEQRLLKQGGVNKKKKKNKVLTPDDRKKIKAYQFHMANMHHKSNI